MKERAAMVCLVTALGMTAIAAQAAQDYAEVLGAAPVYRQVQVLVPEDHCVQQRVVDAGPYDGNVAAGTIIGGVAGGALGNAVGRGSGQALATVVGVVAGAVAGNQIAGAASPPPAEHVEQRCQRVNAYRSQNQLDGYDVTYRYLGQIYHTRLRDDPGPRLPVKVDVQPAVY